jgi:Spy/CpxP family protein refolding chaperone
MNSIINARSIRTLSLALLLAAALPLAADQHGGPHGNGPGGSPDDMGPMLGQVRQMLGQLELTDQQREAVRAIMHSNRGNFAANRAATQANRAALHAVVTASELDSEELARLASAEGQLASERVMMFGESASSILAVLTDEQRAELQTMEPVARGERPRRQGRGERE